MNRVLLDECGSSTQPASTVTHLHSPLSFRVRVGINTFTQSKGILSLPRNPRLLFGR